MPKRAGIIGLGAIGGGIARALENRGLSPVLYDIRPEASAAFGGAEAVSTPKQVAEKADVVLIAVVSADQVRSVFDGEEGLLAGASPGLVVAILSTVPVAFIHELHALARGHDVHLVDIGVTGLPAAVAQGQLVCMAGGADSVMAEAAEVLKSFAASVHHLGPVGSGMAAKIALNAITYGTWRTVHEACSLAEGVGVDLPSFLTAVEEGDPAGQLRFLLIGSRGTTRVPSELNEATREGAQRMEVIMHKDLRAAQGLANELGLSVPLIDVAEQQVASTLGLGQEGEHD
jgi:3-hydroxyisobutyrate dehydrogenase-like beta-hydroxyacid dehydrogenase